MISDKKQKLTNVDPKVFSEMVTSEGLSISQMNDMGVKVILFFSSSLACPYCQGTIDDIYELKTELGKLNIVPVICHEESNEVWQEFIELGEKNKRFSELLHLERTPFNKHFKLDSTIGSFIIETLGVGIEELKRLKKKGIKGKFSWWNEETKNLLAAVFLVSKSKVISEYRKSLKNERIDLARLVIDQKTVLELHTSYYYCDYFKKKSYKNLSKEDKESISKVSFQELKLSDQKLKKLDLPNMTLKELLENDHYRQQFKMFCLAQFCVEYLMFYEEVLKFKNSDKQDRKYLGEDIYNTFLLKDSIQEIWTKSKLIQNASQKLKENDPESFDEIVKDVEETVLENTFKNFKVTSGYATMLSVEHKRDHFNPIPLGLSKPMSRNSVNSAK